MPAQPTVRIGVLTYRRPQDIADALPPLIAEAGRAVARGWDVDILVVDNDAAGSAAEVVASHAGGEVPVHYVIEPVSGIAAARNRVLDESADRDLLVFVDDDERPVEGWLNLMLDTFTQHGCHVVGPVVSRFPGELDPWIKAGGFFDRRRPPTGTFVDVAATNNLLLDLREVRSAGVRFDLDFGLSGGSDTLFTREIFHRGGRFVWCDEAIVFDIVPVDRATRRWVLLRALRSGTSWSATSLRVARDRGERLRFQVRDFGSGAARIGGGLVRLVAGTVSRNTRLQAVGARNLARGAGLASGVFGYRYHEYRRRPG